VLGLRLGVRQEDLRQTRLDDDVANRRIRDVADALRLEDRRTVALAQVLSHSRIFSRKSGCESASHASPSANERRTALRKTPLHAVK
jgi:hypothetical protein